MPIDLNELIQKMWVTPENAEWTPRSDEVRKADVLTWMESDDIEVLGYTYAILNERRIRVRPSLSLPEYQEWVRKYYERCLKEDPKGEWANNRYSAGADLVRVFIRLWDDAEVPRSFLAQLKHWMEHLYREGDKELRHCLVHATLGHLFEREPIREFFIDWKDDPILGEAYAEACLWNKKTPLSAKNQLR